MAKRKFTSAKLSRGCFVAAQIYWALFASSTYALIQNELAPVARRVPFSVHDRDLSLNAAMFPREHGKAGLLFSSDPFFPALFAESADYYNLAEENDVHILSYLPDSGVDLPPQTQETLNKVTNNYVFTNMERRQVPLVSESILVTVESEYDTRNVPVVLDNRTVEISEKGGKEALRDFAEILSLTALHGLPKEIAVALLRVACSDVMIPYINMFDMGGWDSVVFPKGLSVALKKEFKKEKTKQGFGEMFSRRKRTKRLAREAKEAIALAKEAVPPEKMQAQSKKELLAQIEELSENEGGNTVKSKSKDELLFFPSRTPLTNLSFKELQRIAKRQYTKLKRKGRAGILSYFVFNFLFYTAGVLWQWPRIATPDPLMSTSSALMLITKKCGRVFASLYVAAQILKLPKVLMAIAITPLSQRVLDFVQRKLRVSETVALISVSAVMFGSWLVLCGIPILSDFAKLRNLVYMDEKLVQLYGLQPV